MEINCDRFKIIRATFLIYMYIAKLLTNNNYIKINIAIYLSVSVVIILIKSLFKNLY